MGGEGDDEFVALADGELDVAAGVEEGVFETEDVGGDLCDLELFEGVDCEMQGEGVIEVNGEG